MAASRAHSRRFPAVSVAIPTWNGAATIRETLLGVLGQSVPVRRIVIADSSSTDGTLDVARETLASAGAGHLLRTLTIPKEDFHHARTRDLMLSQCSTRFVALLVQDATPADGRWLEALLVPFSVEGGDKVAASCSRILPRLESHLLSQRDGLIDRAASPQVRVFTAGSLNECCYHHVSACVRISGWKRMRFAEAYEKGLAGRKDSTCGFGEDILWAREMCRRGLKIAFMPESVVLHSHSYAVRGVLERERQDAKLRASLGLAARRHLVSVPLHAAHSLTQDMGFLLLSHKATLRQRAAALAISLPYRLCQGLGQWLGTREAKHG